MNKYYAVISFIVSIIFALWALSSFGGFDPSLYNIPQDQPYITPAPYTFAIWGVIYFWLLIATAIGWWEYRQDTDFDAMRLYLIISMWVWAFWAPSTDIHPWLSLVIIVIMGITACISLIKAPSKHPWIGIFPVWLYAWWMTAAIGVSTGTIFIKEWIVSDPTGSVIGLLVSAVVAIVMILRVPLALTYTLAVSWGLTGIVVHNLWFDGSNLILLLAFSGAIALMLFWTLSFYWAKEKTELP